MSKNIACSVFAFSFLTLAATAGASVLTGCSVAPATDDAESEGSELRKQCLADDCPAPPPHPAPHPGPAPKPKGSFIVPTAAIRTQLQDVFAGAVIQISQTGQSPEIITQEYQDCVPGDSPAKKACLANCLGLESSIDSAFCRKECDGEPGIICYPFACSSRSQSSFLKLSSSAIPSLAGSTACTASSCPACSGNDDPVAKDRLLTGIPAPIYSGFGASCYVEKIRWDIDTSTGVDLDSSGIHITFVGTSSKPTVRCDGGPDVDVDNPKIIVDVQPTLDAPAQQWGAVVTARFAADVHMHDAIAQPIAWLIDLQDKVVDKATNAIAPQVKGLGPAMGTGLGRMVAPYIPADSKSMEQFGVTPNGIIVTYTMM